MARRREERRRREEARPRRAEPSTVEDSCSSRRRVSGRRRRGGGSLLAGTVADYFEAILDLVDGIAGKNLAAERSWEMMTDLTLGLPGFACILIM